MRLTNDQRLRSEDALKRKALRLQIKAGTDALEHSAFVQIDDAELDITSKG